MSGISTETKALIHQRWFTTDFPKQYGPQTDGNTRECVEIHHPNRYDETRDHIDLIKPSGYPVTKFKAAKGEALADAIAEDYHGGIYFSTQKDGVHSLLRVNRGFEGTVQKWVTGPDRLAVLPAPPNALDVTDSGDTVALAFGSKIMTWNQGEGLKNLATIPGKIHTMSFMPDGTLAVCVEEPRPDGGLNKLFSAIPPGTNVPVPLDQSELRHAYDHMRFSPRS